MESADLTTYSNILKAIESKVWTDYFPEEQKKYGKMLAILNAAATKALNSAESKEVLLDKQGIKVITNKGYKKATDNLDIEKLAKNAIMVDKGYEALLFYPKFLNVYLLEVCATEELGIEEKIFTLTAIRDYLEKEALFANTNILNDCRAALSYIREKLDALNLELKAFLELKSQIQSRIEAEDFYYWPLKIEKVESFYSALELHKLIEPKQKKHDAAFQERLDKENQILWRGENRQLIYMLFLLYGNQRKFKGVGIHDIACHVFRNDTDLQPRNLNSQLVRIINPGNNEVHKHLIDEPLALIEKLLAPIFL